MAQFGIDERPNVAVAVVVAVVVAVAVARRFLAPLPYEIGWWSCKSECCDRHAESSMAMNAQPARSHEMLVRKYIRRLLDNPSSKRAPAVHKAVGRPSGSIPDRCCDFYGRCLSAIISSPGVRRSGGLSALYHRSALWFTFAESLFDCMATPRSTNISGVSPLVACVGNNGSA